MASKKARPPQKQIPPTRARAKAKAAEMLKEFAAEAARKANVPLAADEIQSIVLALRHYAAYLKSQSRDDAMFRELADRLEKGEMALRL